MNREKRPSFIKFLIYLKGYPDFCQKSETIPNMYLNQIKVIAFAIKVPNLLRVDWCVNGIGIKTQMGTNLLRIVPIHLK